MTPKLSSLALTAALVLAPITTQAAWVTLADATGWNEDVIYGVGEDPGTAVTSSVDAGPGSTEGASWIEMGLDPGQPSHGLNAGGTLLSETGSGASFYIQPSTGDNALMLTPGSSQTLFLNFQVPMTTLALYGSSGNGAVSGTIVVHYADASIQVFDMGAIGSDWFFIDDNVAQHVGGRGYSDGSTEDNGTNPRVYEQLYTLNSTQPVWAVDINNSTLVSGSAGNLTVLAISADAVPEPSAALLTAGLGLLGLARRSRA